MRIDSGLTLCEANHTRKDHNHQYHLDRDTAVLLTDYRASTPNNIRYNVVCYECNEDTWISGRGFIDWPEPDQTYGADGE